MTGGEEDRERISECFGGREDLGEGFDDFCDFADF
jgi:hypothetical protein